MHEIEALAETCSVFRNGRHIETFPKGTRSADEIITLMIGRDIETQFPPKPVRPRPAPLIAVEDLAWENRLRGVSLSAGRGEILGLGGLDGQGQKELLLALFGVLRGVSGKVTVDGRPALAASPRAAQARPAGDGADPGGPQERGPDPARCRLPTTSPSPRSTPSRRARSSTAPRLAQAVEAAIARLRIKIGAPTDPVSTLSGGNQQKVVIAKWLMSEPGIILLNDPTRGIDVGTKQEIYRLLRELADAGACILFYSHRLRGADRLLRPRCRDVSAAASCANSRATRSTSGTSSRARSTSAPPRPEPEAVHG